MSKFEITVIGVLSFKPLGTFTVEADTPDEAEATALNRIKTEKWITFDDGTMDKTSNMRDSVHMRDMSKVKPSVWSPDL